MRLGYLSRLRNLQLMWIDFVDDNEGSFKLQKSVGGFGCIGKKWSEACST